MPRTAGLTVEEMRERWKRVAQLSRRGVPAALIAEQLGITERSVFRIRARQVASRAPRRRFTDEEIARVEAMLEDGCSIAEIARTVGRRPQTISKRWPGRGWDPVTCGEFGELCYKALQRLPGI